MKFSYKWIRELVPGLTGEPAQLERLITMKTAECDGIDPVGAHFAQVVAARVLTVDPLPKGKNKSVLIEIGPGRQATVVCGASNVRPGMLAAWVPPGASLEGKAIGKALIEGVESEGMLASAFELGINRDHSGLLELQRAEPGQPLHDLQPDWIIEIDNKSLTHRPDLWGHIGMAREVAAITKNVLQDPVDTSRLPQGDAVWKVEIEDHSLCPRYSALVFDNVRIGPSPLPWQLRLERVGLNAINNIVDITNYVLAELPQPMHAFDADKLSGKTIYVRRAREGEQLHALNGETYELAKTDLVIADAAGPIALAGVIGGAETAISATTTRIVLESANFQAATVRLTSVRHKLRTDASMRFEKSLDPANTVRGLARAAALLELANPEIHPIGGVIDNETPPKLPDPITLPISFVARKLGKTIAEHEITGILLSLGFATTVTSPGVLSVTVPSWRATKDISLKDDLVEEIGRMVGYGEIEPAPPLIASTVPPENPMRHFVRKLRNVLVGQGFTEVHNYSFITAADAQRFRLNLAEHIGVRNPIASELAHLRRSLIQGLFQNAVSNVRHFDEFRLFEIGNEIHPAQNASLPDEVTHLAALLYDAHADEHSFFELKRVAECAFPDLSLTAAPKPEFFEHPTRTADIHWKDELIGRLFELHPSLPASEGMEGRVFVFDVNVQVALELATRDEFKYKPLRKYPSSGSDLSVVAALDKPAGELQSLLTKLAGEDLVSIDFIRVYDGAPLPPGQKSVSYHLEIGSLDHTLSSDEIAAARERIVNGMREQGYEIRGLDDH